MTIVLTDSAQNTAADAIETIYTDGAAGLFISVVQHIIGLFDAVGGPFGDGGDPGRRLRRVAGEQDGLDGGGDLIYVFFIH